MSSFISKYMFLGVRISFLMSKIASATWKPLETDPEGQQGSDRRVSI
jgi:hypothetical protein